MRPGINETEEKASDTEVVDENGNVVSEEKPDSEENAEEEKKEKIIYYVTDEKQQAQYINMFKAAKMDAVILNHIILTSRLSPSLKPRMKES